MSSESPFEIGQKVYLLLATGQTTQKRFEIVKVWRYPTTFRYLLDTGYVADQSELRATEETAPTPKAPAKPARPPADEDA